MNIFTILDMAADAMADRAAVTAAYRRPEEECLPALLSAAALPDAAAGRARALALRLVEGLRAKRPSGGVEGLIQEFALSSQEGVALMCLAEALLRIPDRPTRDALIRDKIGLGDWQAHVGQSPSLFVNAAAWGLIITGKLVGTSSESGLSAALTRLIGRGGEPLIRKGVDMAMRVSRRCVRFSARARRCASGGASSPGGNGGRTAGRIRRRPRHRCAHRPRPAG